jgi:hypothetical protein
MGFLVSQRPNATDKTVAPAPRIHGTNLVPKPSSPKSTRPYGRPFHKPKQSGAMRPFGPQ